MAERKTGKELEKIKQELNVFDLYSWSKYNTGKRDMYEYFLKYIKKVKEDRISSIYSVLGGTTHDLIEDFYLGNVAKENMAKIYLDKSSEYEILGFKFDRTNKEKNDKISLKYNNCNEHYMRNFTPVTDEVDNPKLSLEEFIIIRVNSFAFQGYIDACLEYTVDGKRRLRIIDWKTSSLYVGKKVEKERGQLLLYALGKIQQGWDIDEIEIGWMFTKYVKVDVPQGNSFKTRIIERNEIGSKLLAGVKAQLKKVKYMNDYQVEKKIDRLLDTKSLDGLPKFVKDYVDEVEFTKSGELKKPFINKVRKIMLEHRAYTDDDIQDITTEMIMTNSIDCVPNEVRELFTIRDCFVEIPFTMSDINELKDDIIKFIARSKKLEIEYSIDGDDSIFYDEITESDSYFLANLCGYSAKLHKPYAKYLEDRRRPVDEDDESDIDETEDMMELYRELGIDIENDLRD